MKRSKKEQNNAKMTNRHQTENRKQSSKSNTNCK